MLVLAVLALGLFYFCATNPQWNDYLHVAKEISEVVSVSEVQSRSCEYASVIV